MYDAAVKSIRTCNRQKLKIEELKETIKNLKRSMEEMEFFDSKVNEVTSRFIKLQVKQEKKKPKGRRYTLPEKLMALVMMKNAPKQYRMQTKLFGWALPSRRVLMKVSFTTLFNSTPRTYGDVIP